MDTAPECRSLVDQLQEDHHWLTDVSCGPKASQLDDFCAEERPNRKDIPTTRPNILRHEDGETKRNGDNQGDKNTHLQSGPQSIQTIREALSTTLNSLVNIRTSLRAEMQVHDQRVFYAPSYHGEISAILDILPFLKKVMEQVTIHAEYLERNESRGREQAMRIIKDLTQLEITPPKKKNGMRRQDRVWRDETNQDATLSPRPQQDFQPQQNQVKKNKFGQSRCFICKLDANHWKADCPQRERKVCPTCNGAGIWRPSPTEIQGHPSEYTCPTCRGTRHQEILPSPAKC